MIFKKIIILLIIFFCSVKTVSASDNKFITIVNPVRISRYTTTSSESLKSEYKAVKKYGFPATWLLTYDALNNKLILFMESSVNAIKDRFLKVGESV